MHPGKYANMTPQELLPEAHVRKIAALLPRCQVGIDTEDMAALVAELLGNMGGLALYAPKRFWCARAARCCMQHERAGQPAAAWGPGAALRQRDRLGREARVRVPCPPFAPMLGAVSRPGTARLELSGARVLAWRPCLGRPDPG